MKNRYKIIRKMQNDAISEIIGTTVLLALAVASFSVVFYTVSTTLNAEQSPQVNVIGFIEGERIILEHHGGESLGSNIRIDFIIGENIQSFYLVDENENVTFYDANQNDIWDIGERIIFSSLESFSNLAIDASVIDIENNKAVYIATVQTGEVNTAVTIDLSTIVQDLPVEITNVPYQINASASNQLDQVTLFYAFSATNWSGCVNQTLAYDDFEEGFGNYSSGGSDCDLYTDDAYAYQGDNAVHFQNSGDDSSFSFTDGINLDSPGFTSFCVDFWFSKESGPGSPGEFLFEYYDGSNWQTIATYTMRDYADGDFYHQKIWVNESTYVFPSDANIRFRGNMPDRNLDHVYVDHIYINGSCEEGSSSVDPLWMEYDLDLTSPWNWDFSFPNGSGYYRFYSIGEYNGDNEDVPLIADASTSYTGSSGSTEPSAISIWYFDENTESIAYDFVDDNAGTIHNAIWTNGGNGSALFFNGDNASVRVERDNNPELDPVEGLTAMAWVKNTARDDNYMKNIIGRSGGSEGYSYRLYINDGSSFDNLGMEVRTETGGNKLNEWAWSEMNESWFHMSMTFSNQDNGTLRLYLNGDKVIHLIDVGQNLTYRTEYENDDLYIGSGYQYTTSFFKGCIDDVRIYNYSMQQNEIEQIVDETSLEKTEPISSWNFNENAGSTAFDSAYGNDGSIHGATWTDGVDNSGLDFDGSNDYVEMQDNDNLDPNQITIMAWIKHGSVSDHKAIVDKRDDTEDGYDLYISPDGYAWLRINSNTVTGTSEVDDDEWHHLVGTYDGSMIRIYVDGIEESNNTIGSEILDTTNDLRIGLERNDNFDFDGIIDQVSIYNTALTDEEIADIYNQYQP